MFPKSSILTLLGVTALASVKAKGTSNKARKFHSTVLIKVVQRSDIYQFYRFWTGSNDLGSLTDGRTNS